MKERAKPLRDGICEFRSWQKTRRRRRIVRLGLRVLFFLDGASIVCTNAFVKFGSTPEAELAEAVRLRFLYFEEKRSGFLLRFLQGWGIGQ